MMESFYPEIRSRILVQSNFTTETQRTRSSRSNIIKCCNIFQNLCVLRVSVVKTADFEIEYRISGLKEHGAEVFHALGRQAIGADGGVEDLDGDPFVVAALDEFGGDGGEVDLAHVGAAEVGVVGVEVGGPG